MAARLSAAVVGTGFIAAVHVDALRRLGVDVLGVVGSSPDRAAEAGLGNVYGSLGELLEDDRIDVVHLTTPNHLRYPQVKQALAAGKHVVCEKPLALTAAGTLLLGIVPSAVLHLAHRALEGIQSAQSIGLG